MIAFNELVKYFSEEVPYALGLKYPEACGNIVKHTIIRESHDKSFLPGDKMTPRERALFAICTTGGYHFNPSMSKDENEEIFNIKIKKFQLIAEITIYNHEKEEHPGRIDQKEIERMEEIIKMLKNYSLTDFEKELVHPMTNGWTFAPVENEKEVFSFSI